MAVKGQHNLQNDATYTPANMVAIVCLRHGGTLNSLAKLQNHGNQKQQPTTKFQSVANFAAQRLHSCFCPVQSQHRDVFS